MQQRWELTISSRSAQPSLSAEVDRLLRTVTAVSSAWPGLLWRCPDLGNTWGDQRQIESLLATHTLTDDVGTPIPGAGTRSSVRGYRTATDASPSVVARWRVGTERTPFFLSATFSVDLTEGLNAPEAPRMPLTSWFASVSTAAQAEQAILAPTSLATALFDSGRITSVGALTLTPAAVDLTGLPASLTTQPCPGLPGASIVVADLTLLDTDPQRLVTDLTALAERLARPLAPSTGT